MLKARSGRTGSGLRLCGGGGSRTRQEAFQPHRISNAVPSPIGVLLQKLHTRILKPVPHGGCRRNSLDVHAPPLSRPDQSFGTTKKIQWDRKHVPQGLTRGHVLANHQIHPDDFFDHHSRELDCLRKMVSLRRKHLQTIPTLRTEPGKVGALIQLIKTSEDRFTVDTVASGQHRTQDARFSSFFDVYIGRGHPLLYTDGSDSGFTDSSGEGRRSIISTSMPLMAASCCGTPFNSRRSSFMN